MKWLAVFKGLDDLPQYNLDGSENLFGDINQDKLIMFILESTCKCYSVNLEDGTFRIGYETFRFDGFDGADFKLIYFRRVRQTMKSFGTKPLKQTVTYHLGWQTNIDGKNYQRVMAIFEDGSVTLKIK